MSFADPISVTIGGTPYSHPRTVSSGRASTYSTATGDRSVIISHEVDSKNNKKGESHLMKLTYRKLYTNPLLNLQEWVEAYAWVVVKQPSAGFTDTELKDLTNGLMTYLASGTILDKFLGNEH
jgi:hypothetical protein